MTSTGARSWTSRSIGIEGPASKLPHAGFERPSHCAFGPDGALSVTDFGEIDIAPEHAGIRVQAGSGTLWRIRRIEGEPQGLVPPVPAAVPFYGLQLLTSLDGTVVAVVGVVRRARRAGRDRSSAVVTGRPVQGRLPGGPL